MIATLRRGGPDGQGLRAAEGTASGQARLAGGVALALEAPAGKDAFDPDTVRKLWRAHKSGRADHGRRLWPVLIHGAVREGWGTA